MTHELLKLGGPSDELDALTRPKCAADFRLPYWRSSDDVLPVALLELLINSIRSSFALRVVESAISRGDHGDTVSTWREEVESQC